MLNSKINEFDKTLEYLINFEASEGVPISAIVLILEKHLFNAKEFEREVIIAEKETDNANKEYEEFISSEGPIDEDIDINEVLKDIVSNDNITTTTE